MSRKFLDASARPKVSAAIAEIEKRTSGQVVPAIFQRARPYHAERNQLILEGILLLLLIVFIDQGRHPDWGALNFQSPLLWFAIAAGALLGFVAGHLAPIFRLAIGRRELERSAHEAAQAAFMKFGLTETRNRTGVLIFISLFERHVEILGDRGIHERVSDAFWKVQVDELSRAIRDGTPIEGLVRVIGEIGTPLADFFPSKSDDRDELANSIRTEDA